MISIYRYVSSSAFDKRWSLLYLTLPNSSNDTSTIGRQSLKSMRDATNSTQRTYEGKGRKNGAITDCKLTTCVWLNPWVIGRLLESLRFRACALFDQRQWLASIADDFATTILQLELATLRQSAFTGCDSCAAMFRRVIVPSITIASFTRHETARFRS